MDSSSRGAPSAGDLDLDVSRLDCSVLGSASEHLVEGDERVPVRAQTIDDLGQRLEGVIPA